MVVCKENSPNCGDCSLITPGQSGPLSVATSAAGSGVNNEDDVRLLTMRQRELTSPLPGSAPPPSSGFLHTSPLQTSNSAFITLDGHITPGELAELYEREDTGCVVDRSLSCTLDLPPRTDEMLQIVTSDSCSALMRNGHFLQRALFHYRSYLFLLLN